MSDCASLLPPNSTDAERALECATARIGDVPVRVREVWNPDTCLAEVLPWLAWANSVDAWLADWTEARQRAAIRQAFAVHRRKGTVGAVQAALAAIDYDVSLVEWHQDEPAGEPYTFRAEVVIEDRGLDEGTQADILRLIGGAKNVRSHLTSLRMIGGSRGGAYLVGWEQSFDCVEVRPLLITEAEVPASPYFLGATVSAYDTTTVEPL